MTPSKQSIATTGRRGAATNLVTREKEQTFVVFLAGGAPAEMRSHARHLRLGVDTAELEVDVTIDLVEALLAAELGLGRSYEQRHNTVMISPVGWRHGVPAFRHAATSIPLAASAVRSFRRASWSILYSAPRVVRRLSASTSIGTPFTTTAISTSR
jgi:hypothetical protein